MNYKYDKHSQLQTLHLERKQRGKDWVKDCLQLDFTVCFVSFKVSLNNTVLFILCVHVCMHTGWCTREDQRTTWRSKFSPSTMWILEMDQRMSGLAEGAFTCWANSLPLCFISFLIIWRIIKKVKNTLWLSKIYMWFSVYMLEIFTNFLNENLKVSSS